jgi:hypothetical protein
MDDRKNALTALCGILRISKDLRRKILKVEYEYNLKVAEM